MSVLATWSPADLALGTIVPLGLAVAAGTCLVIDLDHDGLAPPGTHPTLADLVRHGAERRHLEPTVPGPAYLANGGVEVHEAADIVSAMVERWPNAVLRCPGRAPRPAGATAVLPLLPEPHVRVAEPPAVYQRIGISPRSAPPGVTLPPIPRRTAEALLAGRRPVRPDRWIRSVATLWRSHA